MPYLEALEDRHYDLQRQRPQRGWRAEALLLAERLPHREQKLIVDPQGGCPAQEHAWPSALRARGHCRIGCQGDAADSHACGRCPHHQAAAQHDVSHFAHSPPRSSAAVCRCTGEGIGLLMTKRVSCLAFLQHQENI